jgi:hypothetical protein
MWTQEACAPGQVGGLGQQHVEQTPGYCWSTSRIVLDDPKMRSLSSVAGIVGMGGVACISGWLFTYFYYRDNFRSKKYITRVLRCAGLHLGSGYGIIWLLMAVMPPPYLQKDLRDVPTPSARWLHSRADRAYCACRFSSRPSLSDAAGSPRHAFPGRRLCRAVSGVGLPWAPPWGVAPFVSSRLL